MNAKELIEYYEGELEVLKEVLEISENSDTVKHIESVPEYVDIMKQTVAALSATIPRETAKCAPTREDADRYQHVIAFDRAARLWEETTYHHVNTFSGQYPFWLPMPAAPEVEK